MFDYKIFIGLSGGLGPVTRTFPIAEEFKNAGAEVCFSVYDDNASKYLRKSGYRVFIDDDQTSPDSQFTIEPSSVFYNLDHYFAQMGFLDPKFTKKWIMNRIKMIQTYKPHLIVTDLSPHTMIAAKYLKIPTLSLVQSCLHPDGLPFQGEVPRNLPKVTPVFNQILDQLGLTPINCMEDLCIGDKTIVPSFPEIDPINNSTVEYVGPIDSNFLQYKSNHHFKGNYILVYPGRLRDSAGDTGIKIVEKVIKASRQLTDQEFILVTNESLTALSLTPPKNVKVIPSYTTHMLQNASLFIHHGGHGSCLSSIKYRVPSLILPTHSERYFNAKRISQLGVGDYMLPNIVTDEHFVKMVKYMISDTSYSVNLRDYNIKVANRKYKGERRAFDIANTVLKRKQKRESQ
ncbi:conserved hypothetical protein [Fictibacillus solisalsi]|uniref:Erythromycin biosynthesis protein CIII-like C-terminal domain-containing protein n=1 Tax=Fictibacillus solisalsi TaxID=459525 RepID=A0A1H0BQM1_9BACL|nr:nucleotide disphospho-sugar-binding domain-containing protein [Fictibacillus solisalsi]SDN47897.1 conserved hypothetical protein [Fictibacillus solisalsi]